MHAPLHSNAAASQVNSAMASPSRVPPAATVRARCACIGRAAMAGFHIRRINTVVEEAHSMQHELLCAHRQRGRLLGC